MTISQQTIGGNSCGACAVSYLVQEIKNYVLGMAEVKTLYSNAQFSNAKGHVEIVPRSGVYYDYIDPTKLHKQVVNKYKFNCTSYRTKTSLLSGLDQLLTDPSVVTTGDGLSLIKNGSKRAIGIYDNGAGLHYILTKFENGRFWIKDSNAKFPQYEAAPFFMIENSCFIADLNISGMRPVSKTYKYLGACLLVQ
jgi:hypothetical protein